MKMKKLVVVGGKSLSRSARFKPSSSYPHEGGAAGFFAAIQASRAAAAANIRLDVKVLEATSKLLHKVTISGGGFSLQRISFHLPS